MIAKARGVKLEGAMEVQLRTITLARSLRILVTGGLLLLEAESGEYKYEMWTGGRRGMVGMGHGRWEDWQLTAKE